MKESKPSTEQVGLFDRKPKRRVNLQSVRANTMMQPHKPKARRFVFDWFDKNGPATNEDLVKANPDKKYPTLTARASELKEDKILDRVGERMTSSGTPADILAVSKTVAYSDERLVKKPKKPKKTKESISATASYYPD